MANKLFIVSATLALFFFLTNTNASIYRTIVEFNRETPTSSIGSIKERLCINNFQESKDLTGCQQWLHEQAKQRPFFYLKDDIENPHGPQERPELLQKCCQELDQESPICVCPTLEETAREVKIQGDYNYYETIRIYQVAKNLPNVCKIPSVGLCPFKIPYVASYY